MLTIICTDKGYAIVAFNDRPELREVLLEFDVPTGQPLYHYRLTDPKTPEATSIFLRGIVAGYRLAKGEALE